SKLDVYMMAMIPAVALLIAGYGGRWIRAANATAAGLLILALAGLFLKRPELTALLVFTAVVGAIALIIILRSSPATGTIVAGVAALLPLLYVAAFLMPLVNEQASTRPLAAASFIALLVLSVFWPEPVVDVNRLCCHALLGVDDLSFLGREAPSWDVAFWCLAGLFALALMHPTGEKRDYSLPRVRVSFA